MNFRDWIICDFLNWSRLKTSESSEICSRVLIISEFVLCDALGGGKIKLVDLEFDVVESPASGRIFVRDFILGRKFKVGISDMLGVRGRTL